MNIITGIVLIVAIIVAGLVAIYAVDSWRKVQTARAKRTIFDMLKPEDNNED